MLKVLCRILYVENTSNQYNHPFQNVGDKTCFLEHFAEIPKNNIPMTILFYDFKTLLLQYSNKQNNT